jgi:hypothetical protein
MPGRAELTTTVSAPTASADLAQRRHEGVDGRGVLGGPVERVPAGRVAVRGVALGRAERKEDGKGGQDEKNDSDGHEFILQPDE